ncbi:MAG: hypothetical protein KJO18_09855 [Acidimicrobiia bacterium]|nr:hypothetical protein [Acidimicrobiia bacterium]
MTTMLMQFASHAIAACAMMTTLSPEIPCSYRIDVVQGPTCSFGSSRTYGTGLNDRGRVVGYYECPTSTDSFAFRWEAGVFVPLELPWDVDLRVPLDVNGSGTIVGWVGTYGESWPFVINEAGPALLHYPPSGNSGEATALNEEGETVGFWANIFTGDPAREACRWFPDGAFEPLEAALPAYLTVAEDINRRGDIAGWRQLTLADAPIAFRMIDGSLSSMPPITGWLQSRASAVNDLGHVVGHGRIPNGASTLTRAFLWAGTVARDLGTLPGLSWIAAIDINHDGLIIGSASGEGVGSTVFAFHRNALVDLEERIPADSGVDLRSGVAINNAGQILANGTAKSVLVAVLLTPAPPDPADVDRDCSVGAADLLAVLMSWGSRDPDADVDDDGCVGMTDLLLVLASWSLT